MYANNHNMNDTTTTNKPVTMPRSPGANLLYVCVCVRVCVYVCVCVCVYVCVYLSIYLSIYLYVYLSISLSLYIYIYVYLSIYVYMSLYIYIYIYIRIYVYVCACVYVCVYVCLHLCRCLCLLLRKSMLTVNPRTANPQIPSKDLQGSVASVGRLSYGFLMCVSCLFCTLYRDFTGISLEFIFPGGRSVVRKPTHFRPTRCWAEHVLSQVACALHPDVPPRTLDGHLAN